MGLNVLGAITASGFIKTDSQNFKYTLNDQRFVIYEDYIKNHDQFHPLVLKHGICEKLVTAYLTFYIIKQFLGDKVSVAHKREEIK